MQKWIMHVDMDAFYASIEQRNNPTLRCKPVVVGAKTPRSVVTAASYEARKYGIYSSMPMYKALQLCPDLVVVPVSMDTYKKVSHQIIDILYRYTPDVEQVSIDEAYLDITGFSYLNNDPLAIAEDLKRSIYYETELSCSVGIAPLKFLAKIASDGAKPSGLKLISQSAVEGVIKALPIEHIPGVGNVFSRKLRTFGIKNCSDVHMYPLDFWVRNFGQSGETLFMKAHGKDDDIVKSNRQKKSESMEITFQHDISNYTQLQHILYCQADCIGRRLRLNETRCKTFSIKIVYNTFQKSTRSQTLSFYTATTKTIFETTHSLFKTVYNNQPVRLLGTIASSFSSNGADQPLLYSSSEVFDKKNRDIDALMDRIRNLYGKTAIQYGSLVSFFKQ